MYPISFESEIPVEGRNRLTTFFRYFMAIPIAIVACLFAFGGCFAAIAAWFSIVFTGRYPAGLFDFNSKVARILGRANAYMYLATDQYPPFNGDDDPSYPVRIGTPPHLEQYDRLKTGLRWILGIPVMLLAYVQGIIAAVIALLSWFAILFTGKMPEGLVRPLGGALAYQTRANAYYLLLLTEDWPPFSDESAATPVAAIEPTRTTEVR